MGLPAAGHLLRPVPQGLLRSRPPRRAAPRGHAAQGTVRVRAFEDVHGWCQTQESGRRRGEDAAGCMGGMSSARNYGNFPCAFSSQTNTDRQTHTYTHTCAHTHTHTHSHCAQGWVGAPPVPRSETAASAAFLVASLLLAPWLGRLLHINSFVGGCGEREGLEREELGRGEAKRVSGRV